MEAKPLASLSSGLLARKGQARPAMRPQGFGGFGTSQDDLGWNDMGFDAPQPTPEVTVQETPAVVLQQEQLAAQFAPEPIRTPRVPQVERNLNGHKAAFTLRLDEERHLRLRLASALQRRSSQQLVTEALDALLGAMPELDKMTANAKRGAVENGHA